MKTIVALASVALGRGAEELFLFQERYDTWQYLDIECVSIFFFLVTSDYCYFFAKYRRFVFN